MNLSVSKYYVEFRNECPFQFLKATDPFATPKVFPNLINTLSDSPSNQIELIYFQPCHHYFVVIKEVFNFDTELQSR